MGDPLHKIVEVVEWNKDEKDSSSGHCKISYFEQPNLIMPKNQKSERRCCGERGFCASLPAACSAYLEFNVGK